ncbi:MULTISPECIES: tol-pal system-associated acyl-CoA thioesterase [unclassified Sulfitobacter]|jgi:acyl-CoA thioester hydrolase|uniref:tol-pal system-associated acyl-CoA thioesterase n=1 Tax=unclassified Sulfitobacter TaxID=196795 RepID=UPI0007C31D73|nr:MULTISPECIES: tol-pal system-associated acyl-CoA thioesterase [unclassified Sulfitobacter]KZY03254.1 thioesterase [Sulfitobacter sp. HI0023]KZY22532.1 thioesterase [Sulfitobacter sp. HI0040]KZZ69706.1 thioesterase [Sulfitobacter sp. HI0129]
MNEPHEKQIRVYYEDTDMAGIVYYANYLRYIERARSDWVRDLGIDQLAMKAEGIVFAVRRVEADYIAVARFDDVLTVRTTLESLSPARMVMRQTVLREATPIFEALVTVVCIGPAGRPARLPAKLRLMSTGSPRDTA